MSRSLILIAFFIAVATACVTNSDCGTNSYDACCTFSNGGLSSCIDTRYQSCCANTVCNSYAKCCNATCCNGRQSCRSATYVEGKQDTCSAIEKFDGFREYTSLGVPITLGLGAIAAYIFAIALVRTHRVRFTAPVALVAVSSFFCWIWAILLLISIHAMPAVLLCAVSTAALASLAAIAPAHAPTQVLVTTAAAVAVCLLMMINPLASNSLFSFDPGYSRSITDANNYGGVLGRALTSLSPESFRVANLDTGVNGPVTCTGWYNGYWRRDPALYTDSRIHDSVVVAEPHGLCGRPYLFYIAVIATFETAGLPILFLSLIARLWEVRGATRAERVAPEVHAHGVAHTTTPAKAPESS